jgi:hypothetical protein
VSPTGGALAVARSVRRERNFFGPRAIFSNRKLRNVFARSIVFTGAFCFFGASLLGCRTRPSSVVAPESHAQVHNGGSASRGPTATGGFRASESQKRADTPTIVIGFVGGFVGHDNAVHSPVQLAARLRDSLRSDVYVEVFENRRREDAHRKILEILGKAHDGKLSDDTKRDARVIIYGMSWGGSETVALARELKEEKIPVLLTIQVDSVAKIRENDEVIPANVAEAANFYQSDGLLHGRQQIRAGDAERTRILGNFRYEYKAKPLTCNGYPWYDRIFTRAHTEIECDPAVWKRVEELIRSRVAPIEPIS